MQISDLEADYEESQRNIQQLKKKAQRLTAELQDTKLHLEGQQSRNHDLEKKQRKSVHKHTQSSFTITQFYYFTYLCLLPGRPISNGVITTVIVNKLQCFMCVCVYFWKVWQWAECSPGWGAEGEKPEGETGSRERRADRRGLRRPAAAGGLCLCGLWHVALVKGFSFLGTWCVICELFSVRYPSILKFSASYLYLDFLFTLTLIVFEQ